MTQRGTGRLLLAVSATFAGAVGALFTGSIEIALLVVPWTVLLALGLGSRRAADPRIAITATPDRVVAGDEVFVGTVGVVDYLTQQQARLFRVDRRTGDARGRFDLERPGDAPRWGFASAPAVGPGHVFAATIDGRLYAFVR